jgi:hypothetical protein
MAGSKLSWRTFWHLASVLLAGALLVYCVRQRTGRPATAAAPLDDWDIPRLVAYLNGKGLGLRLVSTRKDGVINQTAFLTTTNKGWEDCNTLRKDRQKIDLWRGTLHCELWRGTLHRERGLSRDDLSDQPHLWGGCCLAVGPFLLFGDRELLGRVREALSDLTDPLCSPIGRDGLAAARPALRRPPRPATFQSG